MLSNHPQMSCQIGVNLGHIGSQIAQFHQNLARQNCGEWQHWLPIFRHSALPINHNSAYQMPTFDCAKFWQNYSELEAEFRCFCIVIIIIISIINKRLYSLKTVLHLLVIIFYRIVLH